MNFRKKWRALLQNGFVRVSGTNGIITLARTGITIFSNKIVATLIGTAGMGIVGQLQNLLTIVMLVSSGGFNQGVTKYIAQDKEDKDALNQYVSSAFFATLLLSVLSGLVTLLLSNYISLKVFGSSQYSSILTVFALTLFFYNLNSLLVAVINGLQQYRRYFKINIATTLISVVISVGLVLLFRLFGALLAMVVSQSVVCVVTYWMVKRDDWMKSLSWRYVSKDKLLSLLRFTSLTFFSALLWPIVQIIIRTYVIKNISVEEAGLWEATTRINVYIVNFAVGSFSVYLLPRLSEIKSPSLIKKEIKEIYKIVIPVTLVGFGVFFIFKDFFIRLLYSEDFLKVGDYLALQMLGSFFWMCKMIPMNLMLAKGKTKLYMSYEIIFCTIYVALVIIFIPLYGVQGIQLSFAIYNFLYFIVNLLSMKFYINNASGPEPSNTYDT